MKIAVLAYNLMHAGALSVGQNIVTWLPVLRPHHQFLVLIPKGRGYPGLRNFSNVQVVQIPRYNPVGRAIFETTQLPQMIQQFKPDFIWGLGNLGMVDPPCRQGVLIHQAHLVYPSKHLGKIPIL